MTLEKKPVCMRFYTFFLLQVTEDPLPELQFSHLKQEQIEVDDLSVPPNYKLI